VKHIRIMIADDHPVWADGLGGLLSRMGFTICPAAATPDEIIPKASKSHPDICLLDVSFGRENSIARIPEIREAIPDMHVVMMSAQSPPSMVAECLRLGASGYLSKTLHPDELLASIRKVSQETALPVVVLGTMDTRIIQPLQLYDAPQLSPQQRKVLQRLALGESQDEAAESLGFSLKNVEYHLRKTRKKVGIQPLHLLIDWAKDTGQIS